MPKVTFITEDGKEDCQKMRSATLMEIAREYDVEGIEGACMGAVPVRPAIFE